MEVNHQKSRDVDAVVCSVRKVILISHKANFLRLNCSDFSLLYRSASQPRTAEQSWGLRAAMSRPGNVILLVHPPSLNPRDFVESESRLQAWIY